MIGTTVVSHHDVLITHRVRSPVGFGLRSRVACDPTVKEWDEFPGYTYAAVDGVPDEAIPEIRAGEDVGGTGALRDVYLYLMENYACRKKTPCGFLQRSVGSGIR